MMEDGADTLAHDFDAFIVELQRVCPDAVDGLAVSGPTPPPLSLQERVALLRTLPDNAGAERFLAAWYALGPGPTNAQQASDDQDA
jgi:hypothetical protein